MRYPYQKWGKPFFEPAPLKGLSGGRSSGKSHFVAECIIDNHVHNPNHKTACIREIQKSIKYSSKKLIEDKIKKYRLDSLFDITQTEIRNTQGDGVMIFQGMQDHTADSIKSLEGFDDFWAEEASRLSHRSISLLIPTFRKETSEGWFTWNPEQPTDPIEQLKPDMLHAHINYLDNLMCPQRSIDQAEQMRARDIDAYNHIWLGGYNTRSETQVFHGHWVVDDFEIQPNWTPLHGVDFGFSQDPTTAVRCYLENRKLYISHEAYKVGLELDHTADFIKERLKGIEKYPIQADSARPESISYLQRHGLPMIKGVKKWSGSVEDGVEFLRSLDKIVIHTRCKKTQDEFKLYQYKKDRNDEITRKIIDDHNHCIDAIRYAVVNLIRKTSAPAVRTL